jgi:hypothetical protein
VETCESLDKCLSTDDQWLTWAIESVLSDFDGPNNDEQDPSTDSVGDRQQ